MAKYYVELDEKTSDAFSTTKVGLRKTAMVNSNVSEQEKEARKPLAERTATAKHISRKYKAINAFREEYRYAEEAEAKAIEEFLEGELGR